VCYEEKKAKELSHEEYFIMERSTKTAVFTYCFGFSLALTTLPFAIYFAVFSGISLLYLLFFTDCFLIQLIFPF